MKIIRKIRLPLLISFLILTLSISCEDKNDVFISEAIDSDGDGILNTLDDAPNDPCIPAQQMEYTGFNVFNEVWAAADCDGDGVTNAVEFEDEKRSPFLDENMVDTDGDGVADFIDDSPKDPCVPVQEEGYVGYNSTNGVWASADCDGDTISNIDEFINGTDPYKACNLNFDLNNFQRELRTVDSNNGEGITIGKAGVECGEFIFTGGGIFNQGCFNNDVEILFIFTPNASDSSEGTISVPSTSYSCLSEDGTETRQFTVEATGTYQGELSRLEIAYTLTGEDGTETGTLKIRTLDDPGDDDNTNNGGDCNLDFDFSNFEGELLAKDSNNGENLVTGSLLDSCNEISIGGDFLNLGCTNGDIQILVFLEPFEEGGSEGNAIVENATFTCISEDGTNTEYTFTSFGSFNGDNGVIELTEYTLTGGTETIRGAVTIQSSGDDNSDGGDNGNGGQGRCNFASKYNTIVNVNGEESFGNAILTQHPENCNEYVLSGDFLNLGCNNDLRLEVFFGEEENGSEVIIGEATFTCELADGSSEEYAFRGFGNYSVSGGFIELSEFSLKDSSGKETNGTIFFEKL